jgi:hypothetical protein
MNFFLQMELFDTNIICFYGINGINDIFLSLLLEFDDLSLSPLLTKDYKIKKINSCTKYEIEKYWGTKIIQFVSFFKFED